MKKCLIIANGAAPAKSIITFLKKKGYDHVICADGGANIALRNSINPEVIIGDLDSILPSTLEHYKDTCEIIKIARQSDTDLEKALKYAIQKKFTACILLSVIGDRLDHSFSNLSIAIRFSDKIDIGIISGRSFLRVLGGRQVLKTKKDEIISFYGIDEKTTITATGLKYKIHNTNLPFGKKESTSNCATDETVGLEITNGKIFVIRDYPNMRKNDLF